MAPRNKTHNINLAISSSRFLHVPLCIPCSYASYGQNFPFIAKEEDNYFFDLSKGDVSCSRVTKARMVKSSSPKVIPSQIAPPSPFYDPRGNDEGLEGCRGC